MTTKKKTVKPNTYADSLKVPVIECTARTSPRCSGKCVPTKEKPNTCTPCHYASLHE